MAMLANVVSGLAFSFAYLFSCRLVSERASYKITKWQWGVFCLSVLITLTTNAAPGLSVTNVDVEDIGKFVIHFGPTSGLFFGSLILLIILTLKNFIASSKSSLMLKRVKSTYMVFGMVAFIVSTFAAHFLIPVVFNDFSAVWVPPALSIVEALMVGYALLSDRFYSLRYMFLGCSSFLLNASVYILPVAAIAYFGQGQNTVAVLVALTMLTGIFWHKTHDFFHSQFNRLIYREKGNPVENISSLISEFRYSTEQAIERLNGVLNAKLGQIHRVNNNARSKVFLPYFKGNRSVLVREELEYQIKHGRESNKDTLSHIAHEMRSSDISLVLPITNEKDEIIYFYTVSKDEKLPLFTNEEILGLQLLFDAASRFIITEEKIRKSRVLAGSIAHEIRNPLTKINYHFERIDADMFGGEESRADSITSPDMKRIYQELLEGKKAVQLGNRFIDAILDEMNGEGISTARFKEYSAAKLTSQALNDFSFNSEEHKRRVILDMQTDFDFHGSDTLYSFVIFNLLKNAVCYFDTHPKSKVHIRFSATEDKNLVRVIDTGPGITLEQKEHIFDEYYSFGKRNGSGLGLAYCRRVMESFGGNIDVRSVPGVFTEFVLTFPVLNEVNHLSTLIKPLTQAFQGKKCLAICDRNVFALLSSEFESLGAQVVFYSDESAKLSLSMMEAFDVILIDANRIENTFNFIKQLRSGEFGHQAQVTPIWIHNALHCESEEKLVAAEVNNLTQGEIESVFDRLSFLRSLEAIIADGGLSRLGCLIGSKVLVVDDMQVNRLLVQSYLAKEGVVVIHASSGPEAIAKAKNEHVDLVLMDIQMPGMNGIEATKTIRRLVGNIPIIALSGEYGEDALDSIGKTMDDHLVKPITKQQLVRMLKKWLASQSAMKHLKTHSLLSDSDTP
ncbi:ATP-binding response regulator [Enterovibrio coralii]|uniref:ATP-binding response regulator n=1 Tax=Enterovibrio coralii TaxID=294935 RepID=UPI001E5BB417|nr:hybrid sensor histidine kinase/response regulator [Enterovibrio coralii]